MSKKIAFFYIFLLLSEKCYSQWDELGKNGNESAQSTTELGLSFSSLRFNNLPNFSHGVNIKFGFRDEDTKFWFNSNRLYKKQWKSIFYVNLGYYFRQTTERLDFFLGNTSDNSLENPISVPFRLSQSASYFMFDVHQDFYLITSKKQRFAVYTGWMIGLNFPFYRAKYEISDFDSVNYILNTPPNWSSHRKDYSFDQMAGIQLGFDFYLNDFGALYFETRPFFNWRIGRNIAPDFTITNQGFIAIDLGYRIFI